MWTNQYVKWHTPQNRKPLQTEDCWFSASPWSSLHQTCETGGHKTIHQCWSEQSTAMYAPDKTNHVSDLTLKVLVRRQQHRDHTDHWRLEGLGIPTPWGKAYTLMDIMHTDTHTLCNTLTWQKLECTSSSVWSLPTHFCSYMNVIKLWDLSKSFRSYWANIHFLWGC